ncbi:hypothetical protein G7Y89_g1761 [Cudoniella acicularis]|uniref:Rab-GAP TBC domain-containing protein n=1 Tax=Cudoniella acicularis TaxID=354080 RepID=A0A8H4RVR0_9HELO|nr:hypothetical protein G7Y89_g1761 [Cudoniella acicularis]
MFSSSNGSKKPAQQEMVQVERSESASPFWRGRTSDARRESSPKAPQRDSGLVVGASYSHADMLKFDNLSLSSSSMRPRTPPSSSSHKTRSDTPPLNRGSSGLASPPRRTYTDFLSHTNEDWNAEDEGDDDDEYGYENDDGDDFDLRAAAWSGVPEEVRAMTWQLLLGYLPTSSERRVSTLERKRKEYLDGVRQAFERSGTTSTTAGKARGLDEAVWHQISIDVPRTNPHLELYSYEATQRSLERILYVWAVRHPASGYVQGINDLVTPFWQVFLASYITDSDVESGMDPGQLPKPVLDAVEADSFWCLTKLLDGIQDNYIFAQPGIQRQVAALHDLTARIDEPLAKHLEQEGVEFIQFSFRWMNCLLMREISVRNTIRMWDTYMAEEQGFSEFHLYVCVAFLVKWSEKLRKMDFQEVMMFLQALPTRDWTEKDIELLLSEAFIWQSLFKGSASHLRGGSDKTPSNTIGNI